MTDDQATTATEPEAPQRESGLVLGKETLRDLEPEEQGGADAVKGGTNWLYRTNE
jgi:hypothetical protein